MGIHSCRSPTPTSRPVTSCSSSPPPRPGKPPSAGFARSAASASWRIGSTSTASRTEQLASRLVDTPDVVVVGAGPTGLMLACELALGGANARLLEERTDTPNITRAFAVHARTLELLDARGLAEDLLPRGVPVRQIAPAPGATLDLKELDTRYPMILIAPQSGTEHVLEARARRLGVEVAY